MDALIAPAQPDETAAVAALLAAAGLPTAGLDAPETMLLVARAGADIVGSAGLEVYDGAGLLRSVAVDPAWRGRGLGAGLTRAALDLARARGLGAVYLLTETAPAYFPRLGFVPIARTAVDPAIHASVEWAEACPASAQAMVAQLR